MIQLLLTFLNLPLPALLLLIAGCIILLLVVACVPSAGERLTRFLAVLSEVFYSGPMTKPSRTVKRSSQKHRRRI